MRKEKDLKEIWKKIDYVYKSLIILLFIAWFGILISYLYDSSIFYFLSCILIIICIISLSAKAHFDQKKYGNPPIKLNNK